MTAPRTMAALLATSGILGVAGPFNTAEVMPLIPRTLYWLVIVLACYSCGYFVDTTLRPKFKGLPKWVTVAILAFLTGLGVSVIVLVINLAALGFWPSAHNLLAFLAPVFAISGIISVVGEVFNAQEQSLPQNGAPALLDRLAFEKRGPLVSLSVEDHYVMVRTEHGEEMVLMRLSDAIRETEPTQGLQVHRSHWVSIGAITAARREGDRAVLTLSHGPEIPVSRPNVARLRDLGLLPR